MSLRPWVFFGLYGVAASSLVGLHDLCVGLCRKSFPLEEAMYIHFFHLLVCQILPCRIACVLVRAFAFGTARPRGSAPRSFRNCVSVRNPHNLLFS